ncbi:hypothetical protein [Tsuneonella mangrovi]|uniref:hypothetical protein n=1 Tax=Tsuneonella mangrovi TaxID=1982042 RepID=UPI000BA22988|nr:hypothetical protein [Tsuneonella mangrovi]
MKRALALGVGAGLLALVSALAAAQEAPESLLPPGFDEPKPTPTPKAQPRPVAPAVRPTQGPATVSSAPATSASPVVQPVPGNGDTNGSLLTPEDLARLASGKLPSLDELEAMSPDQLDEIFGLKPKVDIPSAARRSMAEVGVLAPSEGGLPTQSLANQSAQLVRAAIEGNKGPMVSRWGHIILRRALASRLAAPKAMDPAEFAAMRIALLDRMGEFAAARAVAQDVDTANWTPDLTNAAIKAYVGTADIVGACPAVELQSSRRKDGEWQMLQAICNAYSGEALAARNELRGIRFRGGADPIDVFLAERFAGAAGEQRSAVTIEWDGVTKLTPWRFALANAVGEEIPQRLLDGAGAYYQQATATAPMLGLPARIAAADLAGRQGILSARAMIDLYSQLHTDDGTDQDSDAAGAARMLRQAYVGADADTRLQAIKTLWGSSSSIDYARLVLTAYAAARMDPSENYADDAAPLLASMLTAGLDRNAQRWGGVVQEGTEAWALLVTSAPQYNGQVEPASVSTFADKDSSSGNRKAKFLLAGLAGLGRIDRQAATSLAKDLDIDLYTPTKWSGLIDKAAAVRNQELVALLAGVGMQGSGWNQMTPRALYHIVSALDRVGLSAEARMIAAEAVARG